MRNKVKIIVALLAATVMLLPWSALNEVFAADAANVTVTGGEVAVGQEVAVTISISGNTEKILVTDLWVEYDPAILEAVEGTYTAGGGGKVRIFSDSGEATYTLKFKALAAGNSSVGVINSQSIIGTEKTDKATLFTSAGTVAVKGTASQSKNNELSALVVSPGTLTPAFSKDVTTYNITLSEFVNKLTISATPADAKAKVSVSGASMDPGDNVTKVTVTAENGDQKVYTIYTKIPVTETKPEEKKDLQIEFNGKKYNVISNFDESLLPEGYEAQEYTYKKNKINVGKGLANGNILFCISEADVKDAPKQFVIYNEQTGNFSMLMLITTRGLSYTIVEDADVLNSVEIPEGFVESSYTINNIPYRVWMDGNDATAQYFIIYAVGPNGDAGWYQYDMTEETMQRAFINKASQESATEPAKVEETSSAALETPTADESALQMEYDNYVKKTRVAMSMMAVLLAVVIIIIIIFIIRSFHDSQSDEYEYDESGYSEGPSSRYDIEEEMNRKREVKKETKTKKEKKASSDDDDDDEITFLG
ncbi:MAG: cadherin-like beta sandwich domain-containing protein [Lachnospiraceae bacterium]